VLYSNFVDNILPELSLAALPELLPEARERHCQFIYIHAHV
jgi:hypothetical protein